MAKRAVAHPPRLLETSWAVLYATTSALCYSLAAAHAGEHPALALPYNDVTAYVIAQRGRLAAIWRVPLLLATMVFALLGLLRSLAPFHRLPPAQRARQISAWRASNLGPCREFIRFHESLVLLALFSRPPFATAGTRTD